MYYSLYLRPFTSFAILLDPVTKMFNYVYILLSSRIVKFEIESGNKIFLSFIHSSFILSFIHSFRCSLMVSEPYFDAF